MYPHQEGERPQYAPPTQYGPPPGYHYAPAHVPPPPPKQSGARKRFWLPLVALFALIVGVSVSGNNSDSTATPDTAAVAPEAVVDPVAPPADVAAVAPEPVVDAGPLGLASNSWVVLEMSQDYNASLDWTSVTAIIRNDGEQQSYTSFSLTVRGSDGSIEELYGNATDVPTGSTTTVSFLPADGDVTEMVSFEASGF